MDGLGGVLLLLCLVGVGVCLLKHRCQAETSWWERHATSVKRRLKIKVKILFTFYQIATKVSAVYDVALPPEVNAILERISNLITLGISGIATTPLECLGLRGYVPHLVFWMVLLVWSSTWMVFSNYQGFRISEVSEQVIQFCHSVPFFFCQY